MGLLSLDGRGKSESTIQNFNITKKSQKGWNHTIKCYRMNETKPLFQYTIIVFKCMTVFK